MTKFLPCLRVHCPLCVSTPCNGFQNLGISRTKKAYCHGDPPGPFSTVTKKKSKKRFREETRVKMQ